MVATYMLRKHLRSRELAETPAASAERKAHIEAAQRAGDDRKQRFPVITPENFEAANQYQNERLTHWRAALSN